MQRWIVATFLVFGIALPLAVLGRSWATVAQEETPCPCLASPTANEPTPTVVSSQRLLAEAAFAEVPAGPVLISTVQITLAPGAATQPFVTPGPVLVLVQDGTVTLTADAAVVGPPPEASTGIGIALETPTASAAENVAVTKGEQIALEGGVTAQLRNETDAPVRLLMTTIAPGREDAPDGG